MLLASSGQWPGMVLNIPHFKGSPTKRRIQPMSRLRPKSPAQDMPKAPTMWICISSSNAVPSCPFLQGLRSFLPALPAGMPSGPSSYAASPPLQVDVAPPAPLVQPVCSEDRCPTSHLDSMVDKAAGPIPKDLTEWWRDRQGTAQLPSSSHTVLLGTAEAG